MRKNTGVCVLQHAPVFYAAGKQYSNNVNKLHGKIDNDVRNTKEFLKVMDKGVRRYIM